MQRTTALTRIILGLILVVVGVACLGLIFNPSGLLISFDNRPLFVFVMFAVAMTMGLGMCLISGYALRRFLAPFILFTLWTFFLALPVLSIPMPIDTAGVLLSFSSLLLVLAYGSYTRWRKKGEKHQTE